MSLTEIINGKSKNIAKNLMLGAVATSAALSPLNSKAIEHDVFLVTEENINARSNTLPAFTREWLRSEKIGGMAIQYRGLDFSTNKNMRYVLGGTPDLSKGFEIAYGPFIPDQEQITFALDADYTAYYPSQFYIFEEMDLPLFRWNIPEGELLLNKTNLTGSVIVAPNSGIEVLESNMVLDSDIFLSKSFTTTNSVDIIPEHYAPGFREFYYYVDLQNNNTQIESLRNFTFTDVRFYELGSPSGISGVDDHLPMHISDSNVSPTWNLSTSSYGTHKLSVNYSIKDTSGNMITNNLCNKDIFVEGGLISLVLDKNSLPEDYQSLDIKVTPPEDIPSGQVSIKSAKPSFYLHSTPHSVFRDGSTIWAGEDWRADGIVAGVESDKIMNQISVSSEVHNNWTILSYEGEYSYNQGPHPFSPINVNSQQRIEALITSPLSNAPFATPQRSYVASGVFVGHSDPLSIFGGNNQDYSGLLNFDVAQARGHVIDSNTGKIQGASRAATGIFLYGCTSIATNQMAPLLLNSFGIPFNDDLHMSPNGGLGTRYRVPMNLSSEILAPAITASLNWHNPSHPPMYMSYSDLPAITAFFMMRAGCPEASSAKRLPNTPHLNEHFINNYPYYTPAITIP